MSDSQKMNEITDQGADVPEEWVWTNVGEISKIIHYGYTASSTDEPTGTKMLNDDRLKQGNQVFDEDYFDELLERITGKKDDNE